MKFLELERQTANALVPGLEAALSGYSLSDLESRESPAIGLFKASAAPGLLVPEEYGGVGATALEAVRVQRAIGAYSPSLAVASTMHHFSTASLVTLGEASTGFEWLLLEAVARDHRLVASGFAEGRGGQSMLSPTMHARRVENGYRVSGTKKPCSLSRSMDLMTASIAVPDEQGRSVLAVALIPAESPGITVTPFWNTWVLAGAESDAVTLEDVEVHNELVVVSTVDAEESDSNQELDRASEIAFLWFQLLITASYLGAVSALARSVFESPRPLDAEKARLAVEVEGAAVLMEGMARALMAGEYGHDSLARSLLGRYSIQGALSRAAALAAELLGGIAFVSSPDVAYLLAATHALALHPANRTSVASEIVGYLKGEVMRVS